MTSSASSARWLPAALARRAVVPCPTSGARHLAPEGGVRIAAPDDLLRAGRHAEPEWGRTLHDPRRDEIDAFDSLGFGRD